MGDIEIQIRRSTKSKDNYKKPENISSTPVKTSAITYQNGNNDQGKKNPTEEKPNYWDYSISYGKKQSPIIYISLRNNA